jgi:hypothetical protein
VLCGAICAAVPLSLSLSRWGVRCAVHVVYVLYIIIIIIIKSQKVLSSRPGVPGNFELGPISSRCGDSAIPIWQPARISCRNWRLSSRFWALAAVPNLRLLRGLGLLDASRWRWRRHRAAAIGGAVSAEAGSDRAPAMPQCRRACLRMRPTWSETPMQDAVTLAEAGLRAAQAGC